jgi:hypothetical protein
MALTLHFKRLYDVISFEHSNINIKMQRDVAKSAEIQINSSEAVKKEIACTNWCDPDENGLVTCQTCGNKWDGNAQCECFKDDYMYTFYKP